jgi:myosin heavy subunit
MEKVAVELAANTKEAEKRVKKLTEEVKDLGKEAERTGKKLDVGLQLGNEVVRKLDRYTGGLASKLVAVGKAAKLSGKAMKTALISTGIGALVVALGLVVEYWDEIGEALGFINKDLEKQQELLEQNKNTVETKLSLLQKEQKYNEQRGIDNAENLEKQKQILIAKDAILKTSIKILETQIEQEKAAAKEITLTERFNAGLTGFFLGYSKQKEMLAKADKATVEEQQKINDLQAKLVKLKGEELDVDLLLNPPLEKKKEKLKEKVEVDPAIEEKAKTIEEIAKLEDSYFQKQLDKQTQELNAVSDKYFGLIEKAKQFGLDTAELEAQRIAEEDAINETYRLQAEQKELERLQGIKDIQDEFKVLTDEEREIAKLEKEQADTIAELELLKATEDEKLAIVEHYEALKNGVKEKYTSQEEKDQKIKTAATLEMAKQTLNNMSSLFDKQSAAGKATAAAAALINTYQGITAELATKTVTPFEFGLKVANIATTAAIGFKSVKDILKTTPSNARGGTNPSTGVSAPTTESVPPAFNIVGASGTNQLADAIGGQTQQPVQAYVVASDVSTAQELDRNIIEGASIG